LGQKKKKKTLFGSRGKGNTLGGSCLLQKVVPGGAGGFVPGRTIEKKMLVVGGWENSKEH